MMKSRQLRGAPPVLLVIGSILGGALQAGEPSPVGTQIGPVRTVQVEGVSVSLAEIEAFDRSLEKLERQVAPPHEGPEVIPMPGDATDALRPSSTHASNIPSLVGSSKALPPSQSFAGLNDSGWIPPDTQGAVGPAHLVSAINGAFAIYSRTGTRLSFTSLQAFWAALGTGPGQPANHVYDPKVLYDQYSGRFVIVSLGGGSAPNSWVLLAVSNSSFPTAGFRLFAIDADASTPGLWADYPGFGLDPASVYVTANMFNGGGAFSVSKFWVVDKPSLLAGGALVMSEFVDTFGGFTWQPAHAFGPTAVNYLISQGWTTGGSTRALRILQWSYPGPVLTDLGFIQVDDYGFESTGGAPQPGCSLTIEMIGYRLLNAVLRNGKLWTTHSVDDPVVDGVGKAEVAWYEIDPTHASVSLPFPPPNQQGRVRATGRWYYYPSIAVNASEGVALGFSGSGDVYDSAYYTTRTASDPPGTMASVFLLKAGEASYFKEFGSARNRWGDYSATVVDPLDDQAFWTLQEYARPQIGAGCPAADTGQWGTWWGSFSATCASNAICADAHFCNGPEQCVNGSCVAGTPPSCSDGDPCTADRCELYPGNVFREDFESGAAGWTHVGAFGTGDTWHLAATTCFGDPLPSTMYVSNGNAGPGCALDSWTENSRLQSPQIVLPAVTPLTLSFDAMSLDEAGACTTSTDRDRHDVRISTGGSTSTILNNCTALADGTGSVISRAFDISSYAGQTIRILFQSATGDSLTGHTFAVDNVRVSSTAAEGCENIPVPEGGACNDGDATTCDDACSSGLCAGTPVPAPLEVNQSLVLGKSNGVTSISWSDPPGPYNVYRGLVPAGGPFLPYSHTCFDPATPGPSTDAEAPDPGAYYLYLVTRVDRCRESLPGTDGAGAPIPNDHPCP